MAYAGDLKSLAARIVGSSPTAPTRFDLRKRSSYEDRRFTDRVETINDIIALTEQPPTSFEEYLSFR